jgi:hypothetical protein
VIRFASFGRTFIARNWFSYLQKLFRARDTTARLTVGTIDGAETAAMVYVRQPVADFFRRVDHKEIAGMMVVEGDDLRYFFRLRRVDDRSTEGTDDGVPAVSGAAGQWDVSKGRLMRIWRRRQSRRIVTL